jgi:hypothetical protein
LLSYDAFFLSCNILHSECVFFLPMYSLLRWTLMNYFSVIYETTIVFGSFSVNWASTSIFRVFCWCCPFFLNKSF